MDVSPLRRVNQAIYLLCTGAREASFRNIKTISECLADELINAAKVTVLACVHTHTHTHTQRERERGRGGERGREREREGGREGGRERGRERTNASSVVCGTLSACGNQHC